MSNISVQKVPVQTSPVGSLSAYDWKSLALTLSLVVASGAVTALIEALPKIELSNSTAQMVMGLVLMLLKLGQKFLTERQYVVQK